MAGGEPVKCVIFVLVRGYRDMHTLSSSTHYARLDGAVIPRRLFLA
jgi:hypothetical protein